MKITARLAGLPVSALIALAACPSTPPPGAAATPDGTAPGSPAAPAATPPADAGPGDELHAQMNEYARVMCKQMFACCPDKQIDTEPSCVQTLTQDLLFAHGFFDGVSIKRGNVRYRGDLMPACQAKLAALSCQQIDAHVVVAECLGLYQPLVARGGACWWGYDCADGWCKGRDPATEIPGACAPFTSQGSACATDHECAAEGACLGRPASCQPRPRPVANLSFGRGICSSIRQNAIPRGTGPDAAPPSPPGDAGPAPGSDAGCMLGPAGQPARGVSYGTGSISVTIDGIPLTLVDVEVQVSRLGNYLFGGNTTDRRGKLTFGTNGQTTGTYACGLGHDPAASATIDYNLDDLYVNAVDAAQPGACHVTFTRVARAGCERWEGTFAGTLRDPFGKGFQPVTISEGRFSIVRTRPD